MANTTKELINSVDTYLSLLRFKYTTEEQLSRQIILHEFYKSIKKEPNTEVIFTSVVMAEQLGKGLKLPLKVRGVFLTEGRPLKKYYLPEELSSSVSNPINQRFPLCYDHQDTLTEKIIGVVTKIKYDPKIRGLRWEGHINNETAARNVLDKVIKEVSATIYSSNDYIEEYGLVGRDLIFKELSLVWEGAEPNNYIENY